MLLRTGWQILHHCHSCSPPPKWHIKLEHRQTGADTHTHANLWSNIAVTLCLYASCVGLCTTTGGEGRRSLRLSGLSVFPAILAHMENPLCFSGNWGNFQNKSEAQSNKCLKMVPLMAASVFWCTLFGLVLLPSSAVILQISGFTGFSGQRCTWLC